MSMFARTSDPNPDSERHTEKTASLSLDFRAKDLARPMLQVAQIHVPFTVYSPSGSAECCRRTNTMEGWPWSTASISAVMCPGWMASRRSRPAAAAPPPFLRL
jgi:hypothetical protein